MGLLGSLRGTGHALPYWHVTQEGYATKSLFRPSGLREASKLFALYEKTAFTPTQSHGGTAYLRIWF